MGWYLPCLLQYIIPKLFPFSGIQCELLAVSLNKLFLCSLLNPITRYRGGYSCVLYHFYTLFPWNRKLHRPGFSMIAVEQRKIIAPLRI